MPAQPPEAPTGAPLSQRQILLFWLPLAAQWLMMSVEGPFLAAVIARLADPAFNLAAHGVAFAFAILVEAPVIMLMSASTALVEDRDSYKKLRTFTWALNVGCTLLLVVGLVPPVYDFFMGTLIGLPDAVARLTYGALWILLPWPAAIGFRRFLHGVLIKAGRTRLVAYGTILRLTAMGGTALLLYFVAELPGAWVGAAALSVGVSVEAVAALFMARGSVAELMERHGREPGSEGSDAAACDPEAAGAPATSESAPARGPGALTYRYIASFYYPLALTSLIGLTTQPILTFFMGRAPFPVESLATFPVAYSLGFLFRAPGLAYQEAAIALLGRGNRHAAEIRRFGVFVGLALSGGLALVAFTPLADFWFQTVSGLTPELASFAVIPARILVPLPALTVLLSFQRAVLVQDRRTRPITLATAVEVGGIALLFPLLGWGAGWIGVSAAMAAFLGGRLAGNVYLIRPVKRALPAGESPLPRKP